MAERMVNPKLNSKNAKEDDVRSKKTNEDDVLSMVDEEIESLSKKKGKKSSSNGKATLTPNTSRTSSSGSKHDDKDKNSDNSELLNILKSIQDNQKKQDDKLNSLTDKVNEMYEYDEEEEYDENDYDDDHYEPPAKKSKPDDNNNSAKAGPEESSGVGSRFATMSKRFKQKEITGDKIDDTLASNITDLFRNGMDQTQYNELIKDETNPRPENCEGLVVVKTNQLIWELMSPFAQTCDKKMQAIETSIIKAAVLLANTVNTLAKTEKEKNTDEFGNVIDECNDVIALLGHTNKQINQARRDFIRPELNNEYTYLCNHTQPFTTHLFGDDVSKAAKDIEDCSKIASRIHYGRGFSRGRGGRLGRGLRGRGGRNRGTRGRGRGTHDNSAVASTSNEAEAKNYPRRGGSRGYRRM